MRLPDETRALFAAPNYTSQSFPTTGPGRVCFVIEATHAGGRTLGFTHKPGE